MPLLEAIVDYWYDDSHGRAFGIVWDFAALPQRGYTDYDVQDKDDRTKEQLDIFEKGIGHINEWYAHRYVITIVLDGDMPHDAVNKIPIERRGWCVFERNLSCLVKASSCFLLLSKMQSRT